MRTKLLLFAAMALSVWLLAVVHAADEPKKGDNRDYDNLAQNIVTCSARIKEGDLVIPFDASTVNFATVLPTVLTAGSLVTATATDAAGNMSEFALNLTMV